MATNSRFEPQATQSSSIFTTDCSSTALLLRAGLSRSTSSNQKDNAIKRKVMISKSMCDTDSGIGRCLVAQATCDETERLKFTASEKTMAIGASTDCTRYNLVAQPSNAQVFCSKSSDEHESSSWNSNSNYSDRFQQAPTEASSTTMQTTVGKLRERLFRVISKVPVQVESLSPQERTANKDQDDAGPSNQTGKGSNGSDVSESAGEQTKRRQQTSCSDPVLIKYYSDKSLEEIIELHFRCSLLGVEESNYQEEEHKPKRSLLKTGFRNGRNPGTESISSNNSNHVSSGPQSLLLGSGGWHQASYTGNQINLSTMTTSANETTNNGSCCSQQTPIGKYITLTFEPFG